MCTLLQWAVLWTLQRIHQSVSRSCTPTCSVSVFDLVVKRLVAKSHFSTVIHALPPWLFSILLLRDLRVPLHKCWDHPGCIDLRQRWRTCWEPRSPEDMLVYCGCKKSKLAEAVEQSAMGWRWWLGFESMNKHEIRYLVHLCLVSWRSSLLLSVFLLAPRASSIVVWFVLVREAGFCSHLTVVQLVTAVPRRVLKNLLGCFAWGVTSRQKLHRGLSLFFCFCKF